MPVLNLPWFVYAMLLSPVALVVFAAIYKYLEVRAAANWPSVPGKIVTSNSQVRRVKVPDSSREDGHRFEGRNFANIVFEYAIAGQTYRNNRVTIGEDRGNFKVPETIARYPVAATSFSAATTADVIALASEALTPSMSRLSGSIASAIRPARSRAACHSVGPSRFTACGA